MYVYYIIFQLQNLFYHSYTSDMCVSRYLFPWYLTRKRVKITPANKINKMGQNNCTEMNILYYIRYINCEFWGMLFCCVDGRVMLAMLMVEHGLYFLSNKNWILIASWNLLLFARAANKTAQWQNWAKC